MVINIDISNNDTVSSNLRHKLLVQQYVGTLNVPVDERFLMCRVKVQYAICCAVSNVQTSPPVYDRFFTLGANK
jgi:CTP-dependent riboflavin kinase